MFGEEDNVKRHKPRATIIANIIVACFGLLLARLWYLQVYKGEQLHEFSIQNRLRKEVVWAPRGKIYSRDQQLLVDNIPRFDAILTPQFLHDRDQTIKKLAEILHTKVSSIEAILNKYSYQARYRPIVIKKDISFAELAKIESLNFELPGVTVDTFISREYRDKEAGAHLLGYISEISQEQLPKLSKRDSYNYRLGDFIGQFGVEERFDKFLRGKNGHEYVEVDARGRRKKYINTDNLFKGIKDKKPSPGNNLEITIDRDMQLAAYEALKDKVGGLVALDIDTGEVLAMVSSPTFDPSQFSRGLTPEYWASLRDNKFKPMLDRNIQSHYSPGSTFKAITAIAAFEEGIIDEETEVNCQGSFRLGRRLYHCWKRGGHGKTKLVKALRESCNVFFQKAASKMDIDRIAKYAKMFGLGTRTGISLPREVSGLIPTKEWKEERFGKPWQGGETLSCAIGQSYVLASTLQLAQAYAIIANEGKVFKPYIVNKIYNKDGEVIKEVEPELVSSFKLTNPATLKHVKRGLYEVANAYKGTAFYRRGKGILMAGKTGTSQVISASAENVYQKCEEMEYENRHHGVFVAFAPYNNPKIAAAAIVEHGCHGSSAAAPVVEKVISTYVKKYMPQTYEENLQVDKEILKKHYARVKRIREKQAALKAQQETSDDLETQPDGQDE